jgi:hypothetical protein
MYCFVFTLFAELEVVFYNELLAIRLLGEMHAAFCINGLEYAIEMSSS